MDSIFPSLDCWSGKMAKSSYKRITSDAHSENASFLSILCFQWMNIVLKTGNERVIDKSDFLPLAKESGTCSLIEQLKTKWNEEKTKCKGSGKKNKTMEKRTEDDLS